MLRLLLLRHAKAERSKPGERDIERVLAERGRGDAAKIGAYLMHHALLPDLVVVSTAARTRETWARAAAALPRKVPVRREERLYEAGPHGMLKIIADVERDVGTLLVVGHNPGMQELAVQLVASGSAEMRQRLTEEFPTAALVVIDFALDDWSGLHPRSGRLIRFVTPKSLAAAAD
jgi:phosphohistidine phosphatase